MDSPPHRERVLAGIRDNKTPDDTCRDINLCRGDCRLFPKRDRSNVARLRDGKMRGEASDELADAAATAFALLRSLASDSVRAFLDAVGVSPVPPPHQQAQNASMDPFYDAVTDAARAASPCGIDIKCDISRVFDKHLPFKDSGECAHTASWPLGLP